MAQQPEPNQPNNLEQLEFSKRSEKENSSSFFEPQKNNKISDSEDGSVSVDGGRRRHRSVIHLTEEKGKRTGEGSLEILANALEHHFSESWEELESSAGDSFIHPDDL